MRVMASVVHAGDVDAIKNVFKRAAAFFLRLQALKLLKELIRCHSRRLLNCGLRWHY